MRTLHPENIHYDADLLSQIDNTMKSIYRLIVFNREHHGSDLLDRYLEAVEHLKDVLSIKNAQQEAQSVEEAAEYLEHLKEGLALIVDEIADQRNLGSAVDLFRLLRVIAPDASSRVPNHYRQSTVQFGSCTGAAPKEIPVLVDAVFRAIPEIGHPVIRAIYLHHEIVRIHPFVDGNGRLSRLAKNWMLMYELYPPMFINDVADKQSYIARLEASFVAIEKAPDKPHDATRAFFDDELVRMRASARFILNRMMKDPHMTFEDMQRSGESN